MNSLPFEVPLSPTLPPSQGGMEKEKFPLDKGGQGDLDIIETYTSLLEQFNNI
ncbi:MAG: hypothetical protein LBC61_01470 [Candidatus Peribacteria bacterium]|jgi:hypothetical protein|nr:hypothetical protein [Candidatus Peribacteria bacterium]